MDNGDRLIAPSPTLVVVTDPAPLPADRPFTTATALAAGWTQRELERCVRRGDFSRLRLGVFVATGALSRATEAGRHRLYTRAHQMAFDHVAVASHRTAAVLHELPVLWPGGAVELTSEKADKRRRKDVVLRRAPLPAHHVVCTGDGIRVTSVPRTLVDCARTQSFRDALVVADAALHLRMVTKEEVDRVLADVRGWPGSPAAARVVRHASELAESPGETLLRVDLLQLGYPDAVPQFAVRGQSGKQYRVDFAVRELGVLVEFDGEVKYADRASLIAEKRREDDLRLAGWGIVRVVWSELGDLDRLRAKLLAAAGQRSTRAAS